MEERYFGKGWSRKNLEQAVKTMAAIAGWAFALAWLAYFVRFGPVWCWIFGDESTTERATAQAAFGQLGDFVGGSLNPLLSTLTLIGLVFTILIQHETMERTQKDSSHNIDSLKQQIELSLVSARLQSLAAALEVISEMHRQALENSHPSAIDLGRKKQQIADEILEINESLARRLKAVG